MIKDYSQLPANKRIVNDKEEDVIISLRDKAIMVPVIIKSKDSLSVKATISEDLAILNNQCEELDLTLEVEGPDITDIVVNLTPNIREGEDNAKAQATIATLSLTGGTEPATYKMEGADAEKFILENNIVKAKENLTEGTYSLTFSVIDIYNETYTETDEITVLPAYPLITDINLEQVEGLREGEDNVKANAIIGTISSVGGTQPYIYTIGEGDNSSKFSIDSNNLKCTEALTEGEYNIQITSTDTNNKTYIKEFTITVAEAYPLITELSVAVTPSLREGQANTEVGSVAATITCEGGTEPIVFTLEGPHAEKFEIQDKNIKIKDNPLTQGTYNITVKAVDTNNKTKTSDAVINVAEAYPEITSIKITKTNNLREGEPNVNTGSIIATLQTIGGTAPYSYSLTGTDASSFILDDTNIKVGATPLTQKTYEIVINVEDANGETLNAPTTIQVLEAYPLITDIDITLTPNLREGESNVISGATVAVLNAIGGATSSAYSWTLQGDQSSNFMFNNKYNKTTNLNVNGSSLVAGQYQLTAKVVDVNSKSFTKEFTIDVADAYPEITNVTLDKTPNLREGEDNVKANAIIGTISSVGGTQPFTYTISGTDASSFVIAENKLNVGSNPLTAKTYSIEITSTDKNNKTKTVSDTIVVQAAYPEITSFTISPKSGLEEGNANVQADAIVATMSVEGGSAPITYSLREDASNGVDNASFKVDGSNLKVNTTPLTTKAYKVALTATDTHGKTKNQNTIITVTAPNITSLNAQLTSGLVEGNNNVTANAKIADLSTTGGIAPYTYSLNIDEVNGVDNANFKVEGTQLKVNTTPLVKKDYKVSLKVTDKNNKTATKNITVSVGTPAISALNITPVEDLTAPVEAETVVANLSTTGGIAPYTYTLKAETGDNAEFKIDGATVKTVGSIDSAGTKNITVVVTDKNSTTKEQTAEITVSAAPSA